MSIRQMVTAFAISISIWAVIIKILYDAVRYTF